MRDGAVLGVRGRLSCGHHHIRQKSEIFATFSSRRRLAGDWWESLPVVRHFEQAKRFEKSTHYREISGGISAKISPLAFGSVEMTRGGGCIRQGTVLCPDG